MTNLGYLELIEQSTDLIDDGVILLPTVTGGTFGTVTGDNAVYLLHTTTGVTNEGWIFGNKESTTGITTNVASLNGAGYLTIQGLNISNGNQSVNISVDINGKLYIDQTVYSAGDVIAFNSDPIENGSGGTGGLIQQVFSYYNLLNATDSTFSDSDLTNTFNAYSGYQFRKRLDSIESINTTQQSNIVDIQTQLSNIIPDKYYKYNQSLPSTVWTVNHNLNKYPSVTVVDSAGTIVEGAINYVDVNNLTITFSYQFTGSVDLN